ncbi:SPX N-terminal [Penicillium paradoxum]|uniref:SPX N-terminal n=1 Tax=Penicillium paradoxum TaxID=176176 RepID=UPI00254797DC|nr:SPX N-terminal [Penicillium paradoxum]KAJ5795153.1 SPX N-terminal [Penicillium paradoxum]
MKFAKFVFPRDRVCDIPVADSIHRELEQELVPEWRAKYLDYKTGKKKVKAITRALQKAQRSPHVGAHRYPTPQIRGALHALTSSNPDKQLDAEEDVPLTTQRGNAKPASITRSTPVPRTERQPLRTPGSRFSENVGSYGSILATPPQQHYIPGSDTASFELPDPAIDPDDEYLSHAETADRTNAPRTPSPVMDRRNIGTLNPSPSQSGPAPSPDRRPQSEPRANYQSPASDSLTRVSSSKRTSQLLRRVFTAEGDTSARRSQLESSAGAELDRRQDEFFHFLDSELDKIDAFYVMKEQEATEKLRVLRQQLHIMRDQRIQEVLGAKKVSKNNNAEAQQRANAFAKLNGSLLKDTFVGKGRFGKNSEALAEMATPGIHPEDREFIVNRRDFMRRQDPPNQEVSYRSAKRKLKHALQEFYRGVELLKGYAYLNRTAFRKINKKYDKAVNARPPLRFMSEKVNKASFVQSEVIESLMVAVEDLYARYFERGNRKIAVSKLRHTINKSGDFSPNTFRSGLLLMGGVLFSVKALVDATSNLHADEVATQVQTSYLLQIYGGYFLIVFHVLLFCLDCMIWTKSKINHAFVFEYDSRHTLEWRQLLEIPSFFFFLMGLFMWLNFSWYNDMYIYWPVVLIGLTVFIVFLPARVLYHRSRKWFAFSNWRLLLAGIYPVEFRDFFLGDMYCSQTYAMGNIELFFCLYASYWDYPPKCNSSHSRLLGFFQCLPSVWRAFQCIRRYSDTKNAFPHLLNLGKYIFGVLYYATLSMYRIDLQTRFQATFITFALLNAVYTSVWDLIMDWSLGNPYAKNPMLREVLAFRRVWVYYAAMVLDVVVRFNWIFYAIFIRNIQQSALLSFMVSVSEVCRRGVWSIFRVENEHCTNVLLFRASRDVPLPYDIPSPAAALDGAPEDLQLQDSQHPSTPFMAPGDVEHGTPSVSSMRARHRRPSVTISRVGTIVASAHAQDFERRRLPNYLSSASVGQDMAHDDSTDEDDEVDLSTDEDSGSHVTETYEGQQSRPGSERRDMMGRIVE